MSLPSALVSLREPEHSVPGLSVEYRVGPGTVKDEVRTVGQGQGLDES